jgi:signal peptidase I
MKNEEKKILGIFKRKKEKEPTYKSWWRDTFEAIVVAALLALFLRTFVLGTFKIPTGSMIPNLLIGDHLIVNSFIYGPAPTKIERAILPFKDIERGDIIVFNYPYEPNTQFVKRVIGLPGDVIQIKDKTVYINGKETIEPYAHFIDYSSSHIRPGFGPYKVPENNYFAMGDNRDNSNDSRFWGPVPRNYIRGNAFLIYWSYEATTEEYLATGWNRIVNLGKTVVNFFKNSRWERTFKIIK